MAAAVEAPAKVPFEPATLPSIKVNATLDASSFEGELLIIVVAEEDLTTEAEVTSITSERLKQLDAAAGGALADCISAGGFEGKQGQTSKVLRVGAAPAFKARSVALVGLGKASKAAVVSEWGASCWQALGGSVATLSKGARVTSAGLLLLDAPSGGAADAATAASLIAKGILLGGYETSRFKSKVSPTASKLTEVHLLGSALEGAGGPALDAALSKATAVARGTILARYLVEAPPNVCTPTHLAEAAAHVATQAPSVFQLKVLEKSDCEAMNMGMYLGVTESSDEPPKFIHLTYTSPGDGPKKKIAVIGKGLTFDSGGYNIKTAMMDLMKFDMGGAAATLGAARIIGTTAPPGLEVHFIVAACENMVAGRGMRPGDVLTSANGKTVEINNTDAEGRLTLGDAIWYAQEKCGVSTIIDSATLTGACMVALGLEIAGLFTPSDAMAASITAAAKAAGEKVWRMPLEQNYWDSYKSSCADFKNSGGRYGGAITAALFLKQFVKEDVEWAHLDVAGPVWEHTSNLPTGYGAGLLAEWVAGQAP